MREVTRVQRCLLVGRTAGGGLWPVKRGFQNIQNNRILPKIQETDDGSRWSGYILKYFRQRDFTIELDGEIRGNGKTNVGVPQGSQLSLVIFLIYIAPILEDMEQQVSVAKGIALDVPSYMDNIMVFVKDNDRVENMKQVLKDVEAVVEAVVAKWDLLFEKRKYK